MNAIDFEGRNRVYTKPKDWDEEKNGKCLDLFTYENAEGPYIVSMWQPNEQEKKDIAEGRPIALQIFGRGMPPVSLYTINGEGVPSWVDEPMQSQAQTD